MTCRRACAAALLAGTLLAAPHAVLASETSGETGAPVFEPCLVALSVPRMDESIDWWRRNLGFTVERDTTFRSHGLRLAMLRRGDFQLELVQLGGSRSPSRLVRSSSNPARIQGYGKLAFRVEGLDAWAARLREVGVRIVVPVGENPADGSRSCIVLDNAGNWIQLVERAAPGH